MKIATARRIVDMPFAGIARIAARVRTLPVWVGPALALFGGLRGLGIALLHARRVRHSIVFERHNGERVEFPVDAFPELGRLVRAVARAGVPLDSMLSGLAGKVSRRNRHSPRPSRSPAP